MSTASSYAKALYSLVERHSEKEVDTKNYLHNLKESLARRGHTKLLPQILREYQKLDMQHKRALQHKQVTPEMERTRILLQLYRKLVQQK